MKVDGSPVEEGAVRLAAMEKKRFGVYDYVSRDEIERDVAKLNQLFPAPVADKIKEKLGK